MQLSTATGKPQGQQPCRCRQFRLQMFITATHNVFCNSLIEVLCNAIIPTVNGRKIAPQVLMPRGIHAASFWLTAYR